jgi:hypothetical protein
LALFFNVVFWC